MFTFLSSAFFRWAFGEVLGFFKAKQDHAHEMAMLTLTNAQEERRGERQRQAVKDAADAGIKLVEVQAEATSRGMSDQMLLTTMENMGKPSGIKWIDGFNAFIRPELAQISIILLVLNAFFPQQVVLSAFLLEIIAAVLGLFVGGRISSTSR